MADRPNVIVIVSDTFRPDHIGANGHGKAETPELDEFLGRGLTFDEACVSSFPTIPMRTDFMTGRFGHTRYGWRDLDPEAITIPGVLGQNGYSTQLLGDCTHMLRAKFWQAFDNFHFLRGHEGDVPLSRHNDPIERVVSDPRKTRIETGASRDKPAICDVHAHTNFRQRYDDEAQCALLSDVACRWIEDNYRADPFLLWLEYFDVHEPWFPPDYLVRKYQPDYDGEPMVHPNYGSADAYSPDELRNMQARYASMCTLLSKHVGRVLRTADDCRLFENTIIVFLCDHGTFLGEHGLTGKSFIDPETFDVAPFHREITRICWTMSVPESLGCMKTQPEGGLPQLVQAPDLMPTVLDLCGIEAPPEAEIEGVSLVPLLKGESTESPRDTAVTSWTTRTQEAPAMYCRRPSITDGEWTLIVSEPPHPNPPLLYRSASDPGHEHNVVAKHRDVAKQLHGQMLTFIREHDGTPETLERLSAENVGLA